MSPKEFDKATKIEITELPDDFKVTVNTFVWQFAPHSITLGRADKLACDIFELFLKVQEEVLGMEE